jgi:CheY-like chemotaxis protein
VRPLLEVTADQTRAYCSGRGLAWREDPSNADPRFARARVRHEVLPVLTELRHLRRSGPEVLLERDIHGVGTVLVVDDDYAVRSLAASVLYEAGYTVELAEDGVQAIERMSLLGDRVSLVLLDLTMPQLGGAEAAMELRRLQPDIPIGAMSGYGDVEVMERFSGAHIDEFLPKPFTPDQLAAKVRDVLAAVAD